MAKVLSLGGLDEIVQALRAQGRRVIGPVVRDDRITHAEIRSAQDLPHGRREEQGPGSYHLHDDAGPEVFAWATPSVSWKRWVHPERTLQLRARRSDDGTIALQQPAPAAAALAFFGVRSCDLAGLGVLDRVFLDSEVVDPDYLARRRDVFIVAVACNEPGGTCFCGSTGTGPSPGRGHDLALRERCDDGRHEFLVEAATPRGAELLGSIGGRAAEPEDLDWARDAHEQACTHMGRELAPDAGRTAGRAPEHPRWDDVAERCLACGNCTMVCPTCFCNVMEETTDLTGDLTERWRVWDSCFTLDFSHLQEGPVRASTTARYRQWLLHKLDTWHDQFDTSGCVGCGRCITWCPVGIDLTAEAAALAQPAEPPSTRPIGAVT